MQSIIGKSTSRHLFLYGGLKTPTRTCKCTRRIMQMSYLYASDLPYKNCCKLAQHAETIRKNVWKKSNDAYSFLVRVQTTINHFYVFFLPQINVNENVFFKKRELKKCIAGPGPIRDTLTRVAWLVPSNFGSISVSGQLRT